MCINYANKDASEFFCFIVVIPTFQTLQTKSKVLLHLYHEYMLECEITSESIIYSNNSEN